jgi:hypothetical protein
MSGVAQGLQQIGDIKATIGLWTSPIIAIIFCCVGFFIIQASMKPPPPAPKGQPPNQAPPAAMGYLFVCCGFLVPLIAYGVYKLTMASPAFATLEGAQTAVNFVKTV